MNAEEIETTLGWLTGAFHKRLDENEQLVWSVTLSQMNADEAIPIALHYASHGEFFPTVPEFRKAVARGKHRMDESWRDLPAERQEIPEFVSVWYWLRHALDDWTPLPQQTPNTGAMSLAEYERRKEQWIAAGAPKVSARAVVGDALN